MQPKKYKTGLVVGKFYPFHRGHHYLIQSALNQSENLTVGVCWQHHEYIDGQIRANWIKESFPNINIIVIDQTTRKVDDHDSKKWAEIAIEINKGKPEAVFTSEEYGQRWASYIGCDHVLVDIERTHMPISGTAVRDNPYKWRHFLEPQVKTYFTHKIAIVGLESSGKTTLASTLAEKYKTVWVPEYGRPYSEFKKTEWKNQDFLNIAQMQNWWEDNLASQSNGILFCDTTVLTTDLFHKWYLPQRKESIVKHLIRDDYDFYIFCQSDFPFVQDAFNSRKEQKEEREKLQKMYNKALKNKKVFYVNGTIEQRTKQTNKIIKKELPEKILKELKIIL